jgi:hypothetical protein
VWKIFEYYHSSFLILSSSLFHSQIETIHHFSVIIAEVHATVFTKTKYLAFGAGILFCPRPVTVLRKAIIPNIHKIILINISLIKSMPNTGASAK